MLKLTVGAEYEQKGEHNAYENQNEVDAGCLATQWCIVTLLQLVAV